MAKNYKYGILLTGDSKGAVKALRDVDNGAKKTNKSVNSYSKEMAAAAKVGVGVFVASVVAGTAALNAMSQKAQVALNKLDLLGKTARKLSLPVDELQRFHTLAEAASISTSTFDTAFQRFSRRVGEAKLGTGELNKALKALDINFTTQSGVLKTNAQLFTEFGKKVASIKDENIALSLTMKGVDTEGVKLIEMFRMQESEQARVIKRMEEMGGVYDAKLIAKAEIYATELGLIQKAQERLDVVADASMGAMAVDWETLKLKVMQTRNELLKYLGLMGIQRDDSDIALIQSKKMYEMQLKSFNKRIEEASNPTIKAALEKNKKYAEDALLIIDEELKARIKAIESVGELTSVTDINTTANENNIRSIFSGKNAIDAKNKSLAETCERVRKALSCEDKLIHQYDAAEKAAYNYAQAMADLNYAKQNTGLSDDAYLASIAKINEEFHGSTKAVKELEKQTEESTEEMSNAWEELNDNIQSEFISTFVDMLTGAEADFEDFTRSIAKMWLNTTLNMAFSPNLSASAGGGGNLAGTQTGTGGMSTNFMTDIAGKMFNGGQDFTVFASGNDFSFSELSRVFAGTNQVGFVTGVPQTAGVMGPTMPTAVAQSSGFSAGAINAGAGFAGGLVANQIGGIEGALAGGAVSVGTMAMTGTLAAMGPVGWAALAVSLIMGSGMLEGNSDITPDLNVGGTLGGTGKGSTIPNMGAEDGSYDPAFGYDGTFGSVWASTQHDAFDSEEAAQQFINGITAQFATMDDTIANALGYEMTKVVADAMGSIDLGELKGEDSEDWTATLEQHYRTVFGTAMSNAAEATGNEDWGIWESLTGDMQSIVYVTSEYATATGELKTLYEEMFDIHSKNANIIAEQMGNWDAVNNVFEMLGVNLYGVSLSGVDAANALVEAAGGLIELASLTGYFYETFYSAQEKGAHYTKVYADTVKGLNEQYDTHISTSTAAYKHWTLEILNNVDATAELKVAMLELAPVTAQVIQAEQAAKQEREAQLALIQRELVAMQSFNNTVDDLLLSLSDTPEIDRATRNLQLSLDAFGIAADATTYSQEDLKGWLEYLDTVKLTGEAATLADSRTKALVSSFNALASAETTAKNKADDLADAVVDTANAFAESMAAMKSSMETQSREILERFNDDLAVKNIVTDWTNNSSDINDWLDTFAEQGATQEQIDSMKITGSNIYEMNDQMGKLEEAIKDNLPALTEIYGPNTGNVATELFSKWVRDSNSYMALTKTDEYGSSTETKETETKEIAQTIRASSDRTVDVNIELTRTLDELIQNFDQFIGAVKDLRKGINESITDIMRTQPGWNEVGYQYTQKNRLTDMLTGGTGDLEIYDDIQAAIVNRYNAELELISETKSSAEEIYKAFEGIANYIDSLQLSDGLSPLTPGQRLAEAKGQYGTTLLKAQGGNVGALNDLPGATDAYLAEARDFYKSSTAYQEIWDNVNDALGLLVDGQQTSYTDYESAKERLDLIAIEELNTLEASVVSLQSTLTDDFVTQTDALLAQMASGSASIASAISRISVSISESTSPVNSPTLSRTELVESIYSQYLSKPGDAAGIDYWANQSTVPYDQLFETIAGIAGFAEGSDYIQKDGLAFLHSGEAVLTSSDNAQLHQEIKMLRQQVVTLTEVVSQGNSDSNTNSRQQIRETKQIARNTTQQSSVRDVA